MNALNPVLRVRDQLGDVIDAHLELGREEKRERLGELLDLVGIPRERLRSYPHELSGGMRQRVMIAMALAVDPEVVIMDEPTTALDVVVQREILAQIVELQKRLHFAVLFITHDLSLLLEIADRIAIMYAGQIVEMGSAEEIHNAAVAPVHPGAARLVPERSRRPQASSPGSRARRPICERCRRAARSCRAAASRPASSAASIDMQPLRGRRRRCEPPHRVPVRQAGRAAARADRRARADASEPSASGRRDEPSATASTEVAARGGCSAARSCSRRSALSKDYRLAHGPRGAVLSAVRDVSLRALPQRGRRARRRERLGQVDRREAARRSGATDRAARSCSTVPPCSPGGRRVPARTRATCR